MMSVRKPAPDPENAAGASAANGEPASTLPADSPAPRAAAADGSGRKPPFTLAGRYAVERELGRGGMGRVFLARDLRLQRHVAVKLLGSPAPTPEQLRRLEHEALLVGSLGHRNVVAVHDIGSDGGEPFIVQEFVQGQTLRERCAAAPPGIDEAVAIATQIARGLGAAHEKGIVHCDLKPENILVAADGWVKILDFGIAQLVSAAEVAPGEDKPFAGTLQYSSPEQVRGSVLDARSDIFSFGVLFHELLSRKLPFEGSTRTALGWAIANAPPHELPSEVPSGVRAVVKRCLQKDRRNRFQSGTDLAYALEAISAGARAGLWTRRRVLLAAATLPAAGALVWWARRPPPPPRLRQLTYLSGAVWTARFHPDGDTVVYTETWDGHAPRVFTTRLSEASYNREEIDDAVLLAVGKSGDRVILRHPRFEGFDYLGTAAIAGASGGAPRDVAADACAADWAGPDTLAVVTSSGGRQRLEFPAGRVLYETTGWLDAVRVSPDGAAVAAIEHPNRALDVGDLIVVEKGEKRVLATGWGMMHGLAWSRDGSEIWFTGSGPQTGAPARALYRATLHGQIRQMIQIAGQWHLQDRSRSGDLLVTQPQRYIGLVAGRGESQVDLSMMDQHILGDLSADGSLLLLTIKDRKDPSENAGVYVRGTDGRAPVRIASGYSGALAPDGKTAVVFSTPPFENKVSLVPIGAGAPRDLSPLPFAVTWIRFFPDGRRLLLEGQTRERGTRLFVLSLDGGDPAAISPEGIESRWSSISPGGERIAAVLESSLPVVLPAAGGTPQPVPGTAVGEKPYGWLDDSTVIVGKPLQAPLPLDAVDLRSGERRRWRSIAPSVAGVQSIRMVLFARGGEAYAYDHVSRRTHLYLLEANR